MLKAELALDTDPIVTPAMGPVTGPIVESKQAELSHPEHVEISERFWSLDPANIRAERIAGMIVSAIFLTGAIVALMILWINLGFGWIWYGIAAAAAMLMGLSFWSAFYWPALEHRHASWRLDEEGLEIRRGVFWRHQITIPLGRVQHADVSQGPLQRPFGIGTITIHTAGTQNASVELKGLSHATAIELRDQIVRQRKDQNVV